MKHIKYFIIFFTTLPVFILSCGPTAKLYNKSDKERLIVGNLTEDGYKSVTQILASNSNSALKDTLIIRYDYNNEGCWSSLDMKNEDYIQKIVVERQTQIKTATNNRPSISIFSFREEGTSINKIKKWDQTIIIDTNHKLFKLLFYEKATCGASIIILPDRRFILTRSDSHFEALNYTAENISQFLHL